MDLSSSAVRAAAWSGYAIALLLCLAPLGDLAAGIGSLNPAQVPWRFGAAGLLSGALVLPMLGLGLFFACAVVLAHRRFLRALSVVAGVLFVAVAVMLVVFALDTLQVRIQVRQEAKRSFDLAALKAAVTFLLELLVLAVLAVNLHRAAGSLAGRSGTRRPDGTPLVVQSGER
jgi:hypothetical protein